MARHARVLAVADTPTTDMLRFERSALRDLEALGIRVEGLRHLEGSGELHMNLYLPSQERPLREKALCILLDFQRAYGHSVSVSPAFLYADDDHALDD